MLEFFKKTFKSKSTSPEERNLYAFIKYRKGEFLLYLGQSTEDVYDFMQLPDRYKLSFTVDEFDKAISTKILDFVEQVPLDVFEVSKANLQELEKIS